MAPTINTTTTPIVVVVKTLAIMIKTTPIAIVILALMVKTIPIAAIETPPAIMTKTTPIAIVVIISISITIKTALMIRSPIITIRSINASMIIISLTMIIIIVKLKPAPPPTSDRLVKKPKEAPVVVAFPVDDVLIQILARLPAKTLVKFRCVCKSWNSLIQQDHHFLSLHQLHLNHDANKSSSPPLVTFHREGSYVILNYSSASSPYEIEFSRSEVVRPRFITNSCNGLLGLYNSCTFFIVNPTIRKLRPLPMMPTPCFRSSKAGLGFDASTGVYKVVRIFDRRCEEGMIKPYRLACEVYYLGGSGGWKLIDGDPPVLPSRTSLPVVVDGAILWASETLWEKDREVVALSFDLREEKFSVIMHPEGGSSRRVLSESHVFASGGCICVAEESASVHMNIWLLMKDDKKNNSDKWVKQYVIDFTNLLTQISPPFFGEPQPLTTDHIGRIVISWERGRKFYYDPRTGSFDKHELDATHADVYHAAPYTKSMVWPWPTRCGVQ